MGNKSWAKVILIFRKKIKWEGLIQEDKLFHYATDKFSISNGNKFFIKEIINISVYFIFHE